MPAQKHSRSVPAPTASMDDDTSEVITDALDMKNKSSEGAYEDLQEAFKQIPKEQLAHAAAVCRDLGNEAVKAGRHEEAAEHYTSVLAGFPHDHEVLCNRSLCYLTVGEAKQAVQVECTEGTVRRREHGEGTRAGQGPGQSSGFEQRVEEQEAGVGLG